MVIPDYQCIRSLARSIVTPTGTVQLYLKTPNILFEER
jgi:hypothetical protein